jgi:type I restriction enzyme, R subunit
MHKEENFENTIERELLECSGYHSGNATDYDPETALFPKEIINFIQTTQAKQWQKFSSTSPSDAQKILIASLTKELKSRGMLEVLRNGFKCYGKTYQIAYFQPNTGMNPETLALYQQNRLTLTRQVKIKTGRIPDILLSINGLPMASIELKNPMTGQTYQNAIHQYKCDRDPKDPLFVFKERCLVHFAVDTEEVWMTTKLIAHTKQHKAGHNYLIQHSAGSGKSNSIAWLAHRLANLHDRQDEKIFHTVIVITDRTVLDRQLQDTIYQFDHKAGVVQKIDENT